MGSREGDSKRDVAIQSGSPKVEIRLQPGDNLVAADGNTDDSKLTIQQSARISSDLC